MLKTEGVLHFTIPVKDLDRSEQFYTEILGMEKIRRTGHMVFLRAAGRDNFVLTYSEKADRSQSRGQARDPQRIPADGGRVRQRESVPGVEGHRSLQGGRSPRRHLPGPQRLFP